MRYCSLYSTYILYNGAGSAQSIFCSRDPNCVVVTFNEDSVHDCCVQEGVLSYQYLGDEVCQSCYGMLDIMKKGRFVIFCAL